MEHFRVNLHGPEYPFTSPVNKEDSPTYVGPIESREGGHQMASPTLPTLCPFQCGVSFAASVPSLVQTLGTRLHPSLHSQEDPAPMSMSKTEFCVAFVAHMVNRIGPTFEDGSSVEVYAETVSWTYWDDKELREDGPEACADADIHEMEGF